MKKRFLNELPKLTDAGVISEEIAQKIRNFYGQEDRNFSSRLTLAFGILGAVFVGLGIILIVAHNWDQFPRIFKSFLAFVPMLLGQGICGYALLKKKEKKVWKEGASVFLIAAMGATLSMISQIYNIQGNLSDYFLTWMLMTLPVAYVMSSATASLWFIGGITYYAASIGYFEYPVHPPYLYWLLLGSILPFYYFWQISSQPESNFTTFHHWAISLSVIIVLGTMFESNSMIGFVVYMFLFGIMYMVGQLPFFEDVKVRNNGYLFLGSIGIFTILMISSFLWFWTELGQLDLKEGILQYSEFYILVLLGLLIIVGNLLVSFNPNNLLPIAYLILFFLGYQSGFFSMFLVNALVLLMGVITLRRGMLQNHLGILNYGLLIISVLILCRFFDAKISFIARGLIMVAMGIGFLLFNLWYLKNRKNVSA